MVTLFALNGFYIDVMEITMWLPGAFIVITVCDLLDLETRRLLILAMRMNSRQATSDVWSGQQDLECAAGYLLCDKTY